MPPMLSALAQISPEPTAEVIELWHAAVAAATPIVLGLITNEDTRTRIKKFLPVLVALAVTAITRFAATDVGAEVIVIIPVMWAAIKALYEGYSGVVSLLTNSDLSINDILAPDTKLIG